MWRLISRNLFMPLPSHPTSIFKASCRCSVYFVIGKEFLSSLLIRSLRRFLSAVPGLSSILAQALLAQALLFENCLHLIHLHPPSFRTDHVWIWLCGVIFFAEFIFLLMIIHQFFQKNLTSSCRTQYSISQYNYP